MNALKHAEASNLWISVKPDGDEVTMILRDDGVGYDTSAPGPEGHYGLTMMKERAQVAGGDFRIDSAAEQGTTVTAEFPTSWMVETDGRPGRAAEAGAREGPA
jgi:signal transduction histidine kinase